MRAPRLATLASLTALHGVAAAAALACVCACGAGAETTRLGYMVAPSVPADLAAATPPPFLGSDAGPGAYRALPPEPVAFGCTREILCQKEEDEVPPVAYPPPFERCNELYAKGVAAASFSGVETRRARQTEPTTCCYVELRNCARAR